MVKGEKIGRNSACPCYSGFKYKKCCLGSVDWDTLITKPLSVRIPYISLRGRNILFLERILASLQVDSEKVISKFTEFKRAFTPKVVRDINQAIIDIWPSQEDSLKCLEIQKREITAFYCGECRPESLFRAVSRHSLYADRILIPDPFLYPLNVKEEFSPLLHPEKHVPNCVKHSYLWITLIPWIMSGFVNLIRKPEDFDPRLGSEIRQIQRERIRDHPEIQGLIDEYSNITTEKLHESPAENDLARFFFLSRPDSEFNADFRRDPSSFQFSSEIEFLNYIERLREDHPYFVKPIREGVDVFFHDSTGACYESAKRICSVTNSYLVTDLIPRWKELEIDHQYATGMSQAWSPFAKALHESDLKILDNIDMNASFLIRKENYLGDMRHFFNKVWRECREPDPYSNANAVNLASELQFRIDEAEDEWKKIDREILKIFSKSATGVIAGCVSGFLPAAPALVGAAAVGVGSLVSAHWQRSSFKRKFPAGMLLANK